MIHERAPAKVNLVLQVGPRRDDGLHEICSLFASLDLADDVAVRPRRDEGAGDRVECPGVEGPNLAAAAIAAFRRSAAPALPPLHVAIYKRVPVAAGLGGGSADAAAVLRAANAIAGAPLDDDGLRGLAAELGADVPSQVAPGHALVTGAGERVEPLALAPLSLVLVPKTEGLSTAAVYAEADRLGAARSRLEPDAVRGLAAASPEQLAACLGNDLEAAALSLRPELTESLDALRARGALAAQITGSGPTAFGLFADRAAAERAAGGIAGAILTETAASPNKPPPRASPANTAG